MKIDTSKIEGYAEMTPEQKLAALEAFDLETDYTGYVDKKLYDTKVSELADWKKKYNSKLTEDEQEKQKQMEDFENMKKELAQLKEEKQLSDTKSSYLALGYEDSLAESTAKAMLKGDMATVFANQKKHQENIEKKVKADVLKGTPKPGAGNGTEKMTKEDLRKMSPLERLEFSQKNPDEYKAIYSNQ